MRGARSSPLSPHSILGPGPGAEAGGTTRRHNSTGSHSECSSNTTRSANITRSNSTVVSGSSKSVSPNLSPKSSLSTSSSTGSLKQDMEGRGGGGGEGGGGGSEGKNSEREVSVKVASRVVEPLNNGHSGTGYFVHYREVAVFQSGLTHQPSIPPPLNRKPGQGEYSFIFLTRVYPIFV